jgi:2-polyprenyl-3-methyl-5-hydroxy-6-metoxy-1,4-benzoquinol methylase
MRPRSDTLLVWTGAPCSYGCGACPIDPATSPAGIQLADLQRGLAAVATPRGRLAVLVGGEPFLRPDLLRLVAAIRAAGCALGVVTTGRALVYPHVRERLRRAGLAYLRIQFFGYGEAHDRATAVPGSFEQALAGLRAWLAEAGEAEAGEECDVDVALYARGRPIETVVSEIPQLAREIASRDVQLVVVLDRVAGRAPIPDDGDVSISRNLPRPLLGKEGRPAAIPPPYQGGGQGEVEVAETSSHSASGSPRAPFAHGNEDTSRSSFATAPQSDPSGSGRSESPPGAAPLIAWEGVPEPASPAAYLTIPPLHPQFVGGAPHACCLGVVEELARATATSRQDTVANSFNFVRTATKVPWTADAAACTAYAAAGDGDPQRQLWLVEGERLTLYVTDTADFPATEIARVKDEWSHLFLDRAPAGVLDDIKDGMRRVLPEPLCAPCPHRTACGRRFRIVEGSPFAREEAWIAAYVAGLRGNVLDVGCGEQLYRDEITPLVRSGIVRYHGLDPDAQSLASWRAALPEGRFHLGGIEDFRGEPASYDHILCLRSLNHVSDVDEALGRMAELLKPGGRLLLVECTAFAMLRRPEQVAAADHAPRAGHQHFRNVASEDVLPLARRHGLQVLEHHPANLQTTNEWILLLARKL